MGRCALVLGVLLATACAGKKAPPGEPGATERPALPFEHQSHKSLTCTDCHDRESVLAGRPATPGKNDHAPCDREQCHQAEFLRAEPSLCRLCHDGVEGRDFSRSLATNYPPKRAWRSQVAHFSHTTHLDYGAMEAAVGFHVSCTDCHAGPANTLRDPDHRVCGRCHAPEAAAKPDLGDCRGCHRNDMPRPARQRQLIRGDLNFSHTTHRLDRRGKLIGCTECHVDSDRSAKTGEHPAPPTASCVRCHDDAARTPGEKRMSRCETCHATRVGSIRSIPPRSHLPPQERPQDHTAAFRRDHSVEARADARRCASCHSMMSGSRRDTCDQCHRVMRPRNHNITWREFDHGAEAAARSERCATCHQAEYCIACHQQPPRSHFPLSLYRTSHALPAKLETRSCLACHQLDGFCSDCHRLENR